MRRDKKSTRRRFLARTMAAAAGAMSLPYLIPASALGRSGSVAPSNRVTVGMIGMGRQVLAYNLPFFVSQPDCEVVALCDVDRWRLEVTEDRMASYYGEQKNRCPKIPNCPRYVDFREVLGRQDVDAVMISTPDHWHVPMSVLAIKAGKDVACEKPLTRSIAEGRLLSDLVTQQRRVFRTDSEFRSLPQFHRAVELVRNGRIGKLHTIRTGVPLGVGPAGIAHARRHAGPGRTGLRDVAGSGAGSAVHRGTGASHRELRTAGLDEHSRLLRRHDPELDHAFE